MVENLSEERITELSKVIYTYDGIQLIDETGYDSEGALVWKTIYQYEGSNVKTISQYDYNGYLDTEESYTYTDNGKVESISYYDSFTKTSTSRFSAMLQTVRSTTLLLMITTNRLQTV